MSIVMMGGFTFKNQTNEEYGLVCKTIKRTLIPPLKLRRINPAGMSGVYDYTNTEYDLRQISIKIQYIGDDYYDLRRKARKIAGWLAGGEWESLILHDDPSVMYYAKIVSGVDLQSLWEGGVADITFECLPYGVNCYNRPATLEFEYYNSYHDILGYPGTRAINCKSQAFTIFKLKIEGAWTQAQSWKFNDNTLAFTGTNPENKVLIIDSINMTATMDGENVFNKMSGDLDKFFELKPGNNPFFFSTLVSEGNTNLITVTLEFDMLYY